MYAYCFRQIYCVRADCPKYINLASTWEGGGMEAIPDNFSPLHASVGVEQNRTSVSGVVKKVPRSFKRSSNGQDVAE